MTRNVANTPRSQTRNVPRVPRWKVAALAVVALPSGAALSVGGAAWLAQGQFDNSDCQPDASPTELQQEICDTRQQSRDDMRSLALLGVDGLVVSGAAVAIDHQLTRRRSRQPSIQHTR